ncbi:hypothetical protein L3Y19_gp044 [Gordonia phage Neville]|uniref:Uncharacterized protein n=2 Tax=Nevillevirus TaxID=3044773 RepID=A0A515MGZ8_9CAUD|nr:hypothetical protein L3Y19_gp044 [Gordonia phage Neville]YP_010246028.1 hypothetical protein L3Y20_gp043 [Gordonia phage Trax]AXQ64492.1 hypothetical protein SEA_NEVILLE_44 [Gordonia phage Neville]QDM55930.1 hypothetical protein SEA_TRAX_43 [Gordonia phage Trax]
MGLIFISTSMFDEDMCQLVGPVGVQEG